MSCCGTFSLAMRAFVGLLILLSAIYVPHLGKGFIKDDFRWIETGRISSWADATRVATENVGFYRPLVTFSFSADYALFGLEPFGYGLTNLFLLACCVAALARMGRTLGLPNEAAWLSAAVWMLNFHGIGGALLWLSGRTALLLCLFWLLSVTAVLRGQVGLALLWLALALLSKEEAVLLPVLMAGVLLGNANRRNQVTFLVLGASAVLTAYFWLRLGSGAFGVTNAPSYYRLTFAPGDVVRNLLEYTDRTCTFSLIAVVASAIATWSFRPSWPERRMLMFCGAWLVSSYSITLFLPSRSSLYAVVPSVAPALLAGHLIASLRSSASKPARLRLSVAAIVLLVGFAPLYWTRNKRLADLAVFSESIVTSLNARNATIPEGSVVVVRDRPAPARETLSGAFGSLQQSVRALFLPRAGDLQFIDSTTIESADAPAVSSGGLVLAVRPDGTGLSEMKLQDR